MNMSRFNLKRKGLAFERTMHKGAWYIIYLNIWISVAACIFLSRKVDVFVQCLKSRYWTELFSDILKT